MVNEPIALETEHIEIADPNDLRPNAAWDYAHRRRHGQGIHSRGAWLAGFAESGAPEFTQDKDRALTFTTREAAMPDAKRLLRHWIATDKHEPVTVISLNAGGH